jgi:hypothetical protein
MSPLLRVFILACALGCGASALPEPRILSVHPAQLASDESALLVARVDAVAPFEVDYATRELDTDGRATLRVGALELGALEPAPGGVLVAQLPRGLPEGVHDVRITLADGRSAVAPGALRVGPSRATVAFSLDPISEQVVGLPFTITVRALGAEPERYVGAVLLFEGADTPLSPPATGAFVEGVVQQEVTVSRPGAAVVLTVRDGEGRVGFSLPFRVRPQD